MFSCYSSSSEEEEEETPDQTHSTGTPLKTEEEDDSPARKKPRVQEQAVDKRVSNRLPLPGCLLTMFPDEVDSQSEESGLHGGRIRSFKHEDGNWSTYVYLPYHPEEEFRLLLEELLSTARARGVDLNPQEEFHLSLSQTVVLRHHWIQPFTQSLKAGFVHCRRFVCSAGKLKTYCNAEGTRTFLGMEVTSGHPQLLDLAKAVDGTMTEFNLDTFYKDPSFHVSLAWCVGDKRKQMKEGIQDLQSLVDDHEEGPFLLMLDCVEVFCKTGNKTFRFPLER
ncbi:U6 snRNA phosphodiesterase isoform X2 [Notolabrus celidotus]|uniref:U6 snRNA phosphodiesterase isoform X2 n=1 Tax=Notolabrus celidotus TaxID=1203425 RepID=UPI00148FFB2A|nr:U6 snRNA phosphodiesterase isoform X2 [Notolabrus celidotus]